MAPRFHRRRDDADEALDPDPDSTGSASLDDDEHAWWAQRDLADVWSPREPPPAPDEPERDVLAEHFGADWRTSFGLDDDAGPDRDGHDAGRADRAHSPPEGTAGSDGDGPIPRPSPSPSLPTDEISVEPPALIDTSDPYAVLQVHPSAAWEEIVMAHRAMARRHHPDRLFGQAPSVVALAEEWIRAINVAFAELRVRRGR